MNEDKYKRTGRALGVFFASNPEIAVNMDNFDTGGDVEVSVPVISAGALLPCILLHDRKTRAYIANMTGEWLVRKNMERLEEICGDRIYSEVSFGYRHNTFGVRYTKDRKRVRFIFHISLLRRIKSEDEEKGKPAAKPKPPSLKDRLAKFPA